MSNIIKYGITYEDVLLTMSVDSGEEYTNYELDEGYKDDAPWLTMNIENAEAVISRGHEPGLWIHSSEDVPNLSSSLAKKTDILKIVKVTIMTEEVECVHLAQDEYWAWRLQDLIQKGEKNPEHLIDRWKGERAEYKIKWPVGISGTDVAKAITWKKSGKLK
jgi:hypothetical protein